MILDWQADAHVYPGTRAFPYSVLFSGGPIGNLQSIVTIQGSFIPAVSLSGEFPKSGDLLGEWDNIETLEGST